MIGPFDAGGLDPAARLIVELGSPRRSPDRLAAILDERLDWDAAIRLAASHNLLQALAVAVDRPQLAGRIPAPVARNLELVARRAMFLDRVGVIVLARLVEAFRDRVPFLLLKGQGLADRFYDAPLERSARDIDILVPPEFQADAEQLLGGLGYAPRDRESYERNHFHVPFIHSSREYCNIVELHWDVAPARSKLQFAVSGWWSRAVQRQIRAGSVTLPSPADELAHVAWHAMNRGAMALRDLADVSRVASEVEQRSEWDRAVELGRRYGAIHFIEQALRLSREIWGVPAGLPVGLEGARPPGRWISRNLLAAETIVASGRAMWWPYRQITYWSLLPASRAGWLDLFRSTLRDLREQDPRGGSASRVLRELRALSTMGYALSLCVLNRHAGDPLSMTRGGAARE